MSQKNNAKNNTNQPGQTPQTHRPHHDAAHTDLHDQVSQSPRPSQSSQPAHKILIAFLLNLGFSIFEFIGGFFTNSIAITSDAVHDLGDAASIGIAYFLERYSHKTPDHKYTYGYIRYSVLGGLLTTLILLTGSCIVIYGAVQRIINPSPVNYDGMILLAIFGVVINFIAAWYTHDGDSLNQKSVNLHMLEDVLGWAVVLVGAIIMRFTNIEILDPLLSIGVAVFIFINAFRNFREIGDLFLEKTPHGVSIDELRSHILAIKHIDDVHHIHVWSMDGYHNYATMHVVCSHPSPTIKTAIREELREHGVSHVTIEFEDPNENCHAKSCEVAAVVPHTHHHHH